MSSFPPDLAELTAPLLRALPIDRAMNLPVVSTPLGGAAAEAVKQIIKSGKVGEKSALAAGLWLGWPGIGKNEFTIALAMLGLGGGLFIVPIVSVLQHRPSPQTKGAVQGAASWLSWVGIAAAALTQTLLSGPAHLSYGQIFWACGAVATLAGAYVAWSRPRAMPEMFARWTHR